MFNHTLYEKLLIDMKFLAPPIWPINIEDRIYDNDNTESSHNKDKDNNERLKYIIDPQPREIAV